MSSAFGLNRQAGMPILEIRGSIGRRESGDDSTALQYPGSRSAKSPKANNNPVHDSSTSPHSAPVLPTSLIRQKRAGNSVCGGQGWARVSMLEGHADRSSGKRHWCVSRISFLAVDYLSTYKHRVSRLLEFIINGDSNAMSHFDVESAPALVVSNVQSSSTTGSSATIGDARSPTRASGSVSPLSSAHTAVTGTTDDAVTSKFSASAMGYFEYDAITFFAQGKLERRQPLINRGYYARVSIIRKLLCEFFDAMEGNPGPFQVVNLGAGMDPMYYWLIESLAKPLGAELKVKVEHLRYYEVDFPEVLARKAHIVRTHDVLKKKIEAIDPFPQEGRVQDPVQFTQDGLFTSPTWRLVGADLRDTERLDLAIKRAGLQTDLPTFFLFECVLAYLPSAAADSLLKWTATVVPQAPCVVVDYDPFRPEDRFGKMMLRNFQERGCPLLGVLDYPDIPSISRRYRAAGFGEVSVSDMNDIYAGFLDKVDVLRIEQLELFDELEEWALIQQHYYVAVAVRHQAGRNDFGILSRLVDYWDQSPEGNLLRAPRFSTADARRSTHIELLAETASAMIEQRMQLKPTGCVRPSSHVPMISEWRLNPSEAWNPYWSRGGFDVHSSHSRSGSGIRPPISWGHASAPEFGRLVKSDSRLSLTGLSPVGSQGLMAVAEEDENEASVRGESPKAIIRRPKKLTAQEQRTDKIYSQSVGDMLKIPGAENQRDETRPPTMQVIAESNASGEERAFHRLSSAESGAERDLEWAVRKAISKQCPSP